MDCLMPGEHMWFHVLFFACRWIELHQITSRSPSTKTNKLTYFEYVAWIIQQQKKCWCFWCAIIKMTDVLCWIELYCTSFCFFQNIPSPPVTANSCFFFSILSLSFSPMLASSIFFPLRLFPSPETMVKDNIYRKPPIYRQHGTVLFLTLPSLVWSLHDVLHVTCQSSRHLYIPALFPFNLGLHFSSRLHGYTGTCIGLV